MRISESIKLLNRASAVRKDQSAYHSIIPKPVRSTCNGLIQQYNPERAREREREKSSPDAAHKSGNANSISAAAARTRIN